MARLIRLLRALAAEVQSIQIVDASMALAAQSFLALFPLVIVVYAFAPPELASATLETFRLRFGLGGGSQDAMTDLLSARNALRSGISVVGISEVGGSAAVVITVGSALGADAGTATVSPDSAFSTAVCSERWKSGIRYFSSHPRAWSRSKIRGLCSFVSNQSCRV